MLSLFDTAKRILKSFFEDNLFSIDNILSNTKIEALVRAIDKGIKKDYDKVLKSVNKEVRSKLKNEYNEILGIKVDDTGDRLILGLLKRYDTLATINQFTPSGSNKVADRYFIKK